jgi:hypothetical protein
LCGNSKTNRYIFYPLIKAVERGMAVRKFRGVVVLIVTILALMSAGCSSIPVLQGQGGTPQGPGIADITPRDEFRQVSLDEAIHALNETGTPGPVHIYYIRGEGVDVNGTAKAWEIGARRDSNVFFFVYDGKGSQTIEWKGAIPGQEIDSRKIMQPEQIFGSRRLLIQDLTNGGKNTVDELYLHNGVYTLTVRTGNGTKEYRFDALTGKSLASD